MSKRQRPICGWLAAGGGTPSRQKSKHPAAEPSRPRAPPTHIPHPPSLPSSLPPSLPPLAVRTTLHLPPSLPCTLKDQKWLLLNTAAHRPPLPPAPLSGAGDPRSRLGPRRVNAAFAPRRRRRCRRLLQPRQQRQQHQPATSRAVEEAAASKPGGGRTAFHKPEKMKQAASELCDGRQPLRSEYKKKKQRRKQ